MINLTELSKAISINGLTKESSMNSFLVLLNQLGYSEEEKIEVIKILKTEGYELRDVNTEDSTVAQPSTPPISSTPAPSPFSTPAPVSASAPAFTTPSMYNASNQPVGFGDANKSAKVSVPNNSGGVKMALYLILILLIIVLLGGTVYAYVQKLWPFVATSYTEDNFSSSLLAKITQIESATYELSGALDVVDRDVDATPFTLKVSNQDELKKKYFYDGERFNDFKTIINALNDDAKYYLSYASKPNPPKVYFANSLKELKDKISVKTYNNKIKLIDPETNNEYLYKTTEDGKNFELIITFSTDSAINAIKKSYGYKATTTIIEGKKVTFTRDSGSMYVYFSGEPDKPIIESLGEYMSMLSPDINAKLSLGATSEFKKESSAQWNFNFNAEGSFGDLSYKINADALRKDNNYYLKVNNVPSFFLFAGLSEIKGKWVVLPSKATSSTSTISSTPFSFVQDGISKSEDNLKKNRESFAKLIKLIVKTSDEEKLFVFKNKPKTESVDGRTLTKYELTIRKEKIIPFYTRIQTEIMNDPELKEYSDIVDQGYIDYLKSDEFSQVFDYVEANNKLTFWADSTGFPAMFENVIRVVPPDTAEQLKGKQINLTFKLKIEGINKPVDIQVPKDTISLDEISKREESQLDAKSQQAMRTAQLSNMRAQAELIYDKVGGYGQRPFTLGACKAEPETLFADTQILKMLNTATRDNISIATCSSTGSVGGVKTWAVSIPIIEDDSFSWCVDSTGTSKKILGQLKGNSCM